MNRREAGYVQAGIERGDSGLNGRASWWLAVKAFVVALLGLGCMQNASATLACQLDSTQSSAAAMTAVRVSPATPVGTVLWTWSGQVKFRCGTAIGGRPENAFLYVAPGAISVSGTNTGLTLQVAYGGSDYSQATWIDTGISVTSPWVTSLLSNQAVNVNLTIKLVKTGATSSSGVTMPTSQFVAGLASNRAVPTDNRFLVANLKATTFVGSTCTVQTPSVNVNVDLGQVKLSKTSGFGSAVGTTSSPKDFVIDMNCDTGASGSYGVYMQLAATPVAGLGNSGVFALSAGSSATGLGIQLLRGSASAQTPVQLGTPWQIGSFPMTDAKLSVPLSARYYQTGSTITPGTANGTATFTITYQ